MAGYALASPPWILPNRLPTRNRSPRRYAALPLGAALGLEPTTAAFAAPAVDARTDPVGARHGRHDWRYVAHYSSRLNILGLCIFMGSADVLDE